MGKGSSLCASDAYDLALRQKKKQEKRARNKAGSKRRSQLKKQFGRAICVKSPALHLDRDLAEMKKNRQLSRFPVLVSGSIQTRDDYLNMLMDAMGESEDIGLTRDKTSQRLFEKLITGRGDLNIEIRPDAFLIGSNYTFEMAVDDLISEIRARESLDEFIMVCESTKDSGLVFRIYGDVNQGFLHELPYLQRLTVTNKGGNRIKFKNRSESLEYRKVA